MMDGDERSAVDIDLNIVRLCFEAFLPDREGHYTRKLTPVVSNPIFDKSKKSTISLKYFIFMKTGKFKLKNYASCNKRRLSQLLHMGIA